MTQVYYPSKKNGFIWGIMLLILIVAPLGAILVALRKTHVDGSLLSIVLIVFSFLLALFLYFLYALKTMRYQIDADSVTLNWGTVRYTIPMTAILEARKVEGPLVGLRTFGGSWPGCHFGLFRFRGYGQVEVYSTRLRGDIVLLRTTAQTYLISPDDTDAFLAVLHETMALALAPALTPALMPTSHRMAGRVHLAGSTAAADAIRFRQPMSFFRDPIAIALVLANVALLAVVFIYLTRLMPTLPEKIPAHWDLAGNVNRYGNREELYMLPAVGALTAALPLVMGFTQHGKNRKILYISAAVGLLLQVLFISILGGWIGKINLI
ncbi:MAG TPA: hypothetical protein DF292_08805 [Firmicutes bacterium]|jgi:hypothetical protein|nr:hypothetical protein [Bacillota bacterium]